jgi:predicted nucleic acid-binding Zn ribbon protein
MVDLFHAMSARRRVKCPECGGRCRRLLGTGAAVIFKGSGFYETDYKKSDGKKDEPKGEPKTEAKKEGRTDSKTESKAESKSESSKSGTGSIE